jgi:hypothetical protein
MRAHECPRAILFDTLHEQIGNPQCVKEITSACLFFAVVLSKIQPVDDICMPWLKVDGESTGALVTTLINVASSGIEDTEHRDKSVGCAIGSTYV